MNDDPRFPEGFWAGADIFASLSDNVQESFGLTPVEAMAAGLPAIVSDWNGYRGGVREGQEGFLIPTFTPPSENGLAIAEHYYNEQNYGVALVGASQSTTVDINRCAAALHLLIEDEAKRKQMGQNGRVRARDIFDWRHIIKSYEDLWAELERKRQSATISPGTPKNWQAAHPAFPNPWAMFSSFPSGFLAPSDKFRVVLGNNEINQLLRHEMNFFTAELLLPKELLLGIIEVIRNAGAPTINDIITSFPVEEHGRVWRSLGLTFKLGICERIP